jgi:hypothetical protein
MSGGVTCASAHGVHAAQSKSDGHSTLNENSICASFGSKPAGGSSLPEAATRCSV